MGGGCCNPSGEAPEGEALGLHVHNSLGNGLQEFRPRAAGSRKVRWYTCGPTVYDVAHMGHARAYLTFDILRRVIEDYFGYEVLYQMNITDIDDKIILRARRNHLLAEYARAAPPFDRVLADVMAAVDGLVAKQERKLAALQEPLPEGADKRLVEERETLQKEQALKAGQAREMAEKVRAAAAGGEAAAVIAAGQDALAEALDAEKGGSVTDHTIFDAHSRRFEAEFHKDMEDLGVRPADVITRVSEFVPEVVDYIQKIIDQGCAYESNGSVYFDTANFKGKGHTYRKLVPFTGETTEAEMAESEGSLAAGGEKKTPNDFALWKASKVGEPEWDSPWGKGRPGWHIECSVMASEVLGKHLDIHAGGSDLKFPHHDNELAQAEAYYSHHNWVNYFLHAGHLHIKGLKMSKSLKNFITIQQALKEHSARQLRFMFLLQQWDKPMYYSDQAMGDAKAKEALFKNFFGAVKAMLRDVWHAQPQPWRECDRAFEAALADCQQRVHASLCHNFNTVDAMQAMCDLVNEANKYLKLDNPLTLLLRKAAGYVMRILKVFGVVDGTDDLGLGSAQAGGSVESTIAPHVSALVAFRDEVRKLARVQGSQEALALCDQVRDEVLVDLGIRVEDRPDKSLWKLDDPNTLRKELEVKRQQQEEAARKKRANKLERLKKDVAKWQAASVEPSEFFKQGAYAGKYSQFDENGFPQKDAQGEDLPKSQTKACNKELNKHTKVHEQLKAKGDGFLDGLVREMEELST